MRIAAKITALYLAVALLAGCLLWVFVGQREFQIAQAGVVQRAEAAVQGRPDLQVEIYRADQRRLLSILLELMTPGKATISAVYDSAGKQLAQRDVKGERSESLTSLGFVRRDVSVADTGVKILDSKGAPRTSSFLNIFMAGDSTLHLTVPVYSSVNPAQKGLGIKDFMISLVRPESGGARVVMGYVHLVVPADELAAESRVAAGKLAALYGALMLLGALLLYLRARKITAPLSQLTSIAEQVSAGVQMEPLDSNTDGEIGDAVQGFNKLIESINAYKNEIEVDRKLLGMKVDESATKLSQRDEELSRATEEITEANERLHKLAYYDSLTSLPNRTLFSEQLRLLLSMSVREGKPLALMILSVNQFKRVNDSLGRRASDALLGEVAKRLTSCLRSSDMLGHYTGSGPRIDVSRLGGDEFSVVLNQLDGVESASVIAQRVCAALSVPVEIEGHELVVTPSVGVAVAPQDGRDVDALMRAAASAMHHAKSEAKGGFVLYKHNMDAGGLDHIKLEAELRKAVERKQMLLHYQPQVDTVDGSIIAVEALLRWEHPEFGQVPPFRFIGIAQEIGLMDELGNWVLMEACRQLVAFRAQGLELPRVAINVSRLQFGESFTQRLKEVLVETALPPSSIELGLSEEILAVNDSDTMKSLRELADMGVYLAIDNFGTTHAPLSYLSQYPLNELKIDRSFVSECDLRIANGSLVKAIIAMSESLDLRVVAEGVETEKEYIFLSENGVRAMQGYLFSKPVPAEEVEKLLGIPWCFMSQVERIRRANQLQSGGSL